MGKASTKENKSIYQLVREELNLTREIASDKCEGMSPERIERIENNKCSILPFDVISLADGYGHPELCNYYCSNECEIGCRYTPEVKIHDLSTIVLKTVSSLNRLKKTQDDLIEITEDGSIDESELKKFIEIQNELKNMSIAINAMQLWCERMLASGAIDKDLYDKLNTEILE